MSDSKGVNKILNWNRLIQIWPLVLFPILSFLILNFALDFNGLYGQDSHEYLRYANDFKSVLFTDKSTQNFYWAKAYPILGAFLSYTGVSVLLALRFISLFAFILTLIYTRKIIFLLFQKESKWFLVLAAVLQAYFLRSGVLVMSDITSTCFVVLTFYSYFQFSKTHKILNFIGIVAFSMLALFSRYASLPLLILPAIGGVWILFKNYNKWVVGILVFALLGALIYLGYFNNHLYKHGVNIGDRWGLQNIFSRTLHSNDGTTRHLVPNIMYVFGNFFHLGLLSFGFLLIPFYKYLRKPNFILLGSILLYLILLVGFSTQNYRFLVMSHPLVLILLFPAFEALKNWLSDKKIYKLTYIAFAGLNITFFCYSFNKTYRVFRVEKEVVEELKELDDSSPIYSFYVDQSFASYGVENEVRNFYYEEYVDFEKGALVVFNEPKFKEQWEGKNVMNNWNHLKSNYELDTLVELSDNWKIYRIK